MKQRTIIVANTVRPAKSLVEKLAGSVVVPSKFKGVSVEKTIKQAKQKHFSGKFK